MKQKRTLNLHTKQNNPCVDHFWLFSKTRSLSLRLTSLTDSTSLSEFGSSMLKNESTHELTHDPSVDS